MILTYKFVRLIEDHSDVLARGLLQKVQHSERTEAYRNVPPEDLKLQVYEIYRHLGEWLMDKSEGDVGHRYTELGTRRARQGVPLSQVIWAIILTKENLWEFVVNESFPDRAVEIFGKQELLQLLDQFFDRAIHATAVGYEWATEANIKKVEDKTHKAG